MKGKGNNIVPMELDNSTLAKDEALISPPPAKPGKGGKAGKGEKKHNLFVRFFLRIGRAFKEMYSELKKVSWAPWKKVLASTGVVLVVVLFFLLVLGIFDFGLTALFNLVIDA